jgi:hypothetical protein
MHVTDGCSAAEDKQGQVAQPGVLCGADAVLAAGAAAVAQLQIGELAAVRAGGKQVNRWPSRSVKRSWAPGCGRSLRSCPQQHRQRLPGALGTVISEDR